ncbi:hypothetical protein [Butyrivibrio sp. XPD2002]|uniref:hypothetical protein n=1 Tax=Butyrivibrio sp. XPD2002 TaxID=1280665 RepID=UPI0012DE9A08|nr:hypothetical protein [Butyrivibrio sp. XPD2002]
MTITDIYKKKMAGMNKKQYCFGIKINDIFDSVFKFLNMQTYFFFHMCFPKDMRRDSNIPEEKCA